MTNHPPGVTAPRIGSLCSGAGGLDLAVEEVFGARTVWHCEINDAASKVLEARWPGVPNHRDLTNVDWQLVEPIDILTAGFPCQDVSAAGRRAGLKKGTRTGVFIHIVDAINALRPAHVVLENVAGLFTADGDEWPDSVHALNDEAARWHRVITLIGHKKAKAERKGNRDREWWNRKHAEGIRASRRHRVAMAEFRRERARLVPRAIATVLGSLAQAGYDTTWRSLRASDVGAPHRRDRLFIVAHAGGGRLEVVAQRDGEPEQLELKAPQRRDAGGRSDATSDTTRDGRHEGRTEPARQLGGSDAPVGGDGAVELLPTPAASNPNDSETPETWLARRDEVKARLRNGNGMGMPLGIAVQLLPTPRRSDGDGDGDGGANPMSSAERMDDVETRVIRLLQTPSAADGAGSRKARGGGRGNEPLLPGQAVEMAGQWGKYAPAIARWEQIAGPAPSPTEPNTKGNPRLNPAFSEWMMGWPAGWVTDVPGVPRNDQLRIIGNGVVPQCAEAALRHLLSLGLAA